jgi:hypothetical protein
MKLKYFVIFTAFSGLLSSENRKPNEYYAGRGYAFYYKYKGDCAHVIAKFYNDDTGKILKNAYQIESVPPGYEQAHGRDWEIDYTIQQWNKCLATRPNFESLFESIYYNGKLYKKCVKIEDCKKYFDRDFKAVFAKRNDKAFKIELRWENIGFFV